MAAVPHEKPELEGEPDAKRPRTEGDFYCIVTGGTGLVGKGIQACLAKNGDTRRFEFIGSKDCDLTNFEETRAYFNEKKPTHVIHLAAMVGGLFKNMENNAGMFHSNNAINENVIRACDECGAQKVVSCLSTCIFPDKTTYPIDETMVHNGPPHDSNIGYAYSKRMVDVMNKIYTDKNKGSGRVFTSVIPTNVYGPHDNWDLHDSHVIPGLIHRCFLTKKAREGGSEEKFSIWGSGTPLRQFIHSEDLGQLMLYVLDLYDETDPIICSVGEEDEVAIRDVAKLIVGAMGMDPEADLEYDTTKADGQFKKTASNERIKAFLVDKGVDFSFKPIDEGINETVAWFLKNVEENPAVVRGYSA